MSVSFGDGAGGGCGTDQEPELLLVYSALRDRGSPRRDILDEAADDLDASATWYEEQHEGLGLELVAEFRERLDFALENPALGISLEVAGGSIGRWTNRT